MNQSQFLAITRNSLEAREKSRVHGAIGFGFASHWLKNWRESLKLITKRSQSCNYFRQSFENCSIRETFPLVFISIDCIEYFHPPFTTAEPAF